jgi:hypothetical protein
MAGKDTRMSLGHLSGKGNEGRTEPTAPLRRAHDRYWSNRSVTRSIQHCSHLSGHKDRKAHGGPLGLSPACNEGTEGVTSGRGARICDPSTQEATVRKVTGLRPAGAT